MRKLILSLACPVIILLAGLTPAYALDCSATASTKDAIQCGTQQASGDNTDPAKAADTANSALTKGINLASTAGGILAVIFLIVGGYRYITSGGASDKVTSAKNTILYALIGLVIIALAQVMVKFVLNQATG